MKRHVRWLLMAALMVPMVAMAQENTCMLTVNWADASGNGWVGDELGGNRPSVLRFYQDGMLIDTLSPAAGASGTMLLTVTQGELTLVWKQGDYDNQCSFTLVAPNGAQIYQCLSANFGEGDTVCTVSDPCSGCYPASGLHIDSLGSDQVWLGWNAGSAEYDIEYGERGFTPGNGVTVSLDTNGVLLEGLEPGMMYDVYAYSICGGQRTEPTRFGFITPGDTVRDYPYSTGFEPGDDCGWTFVQGGVNQWTIGEGAGSEGDFGLYISNDGGQSNAYTDIMTLSYAYRTFELDTGTYVLSFDYRVGGDNYTDFMHVFLVPAGIEFTADQIPTGVASLMQFRYSTQLPSGWTNIGYSNGTRPYSGHTSWTNKQTTISFTPVTAGSYNLLFLWCNDNGTNEPTPAAIDNVVLMRNTCPMPTSLSLDSVAATEAWLQWIAGGSEDTWQLSIDGGEWDNIWDNPYHVEGLTPGTAYNVRLRALCNDYEYSIGTSLTFSTTCPDSLRIYPYNERFEAYTTGVDGTMNPCWQRGNIGGGTAPYVQSAGGNRYLQFSSSGLVGGNYGYVVLPPIADDINAMEVTLDLARFGSNRIDTLLVCMVADSMNNGSIDTIATLCATSQYFSHHIVRLDNYEGGNRRVALVAPPSYFDGNPFGSNPNNRPKVDNVCVRPIPTCEEPTGLVVTGTSETSISISWNGVDGAHTYVVAHRVAGTEEWSEAEATDTAAVIEDLDAGTQYEVSVRNYCSYDDTSYAVTTTCTTLCDALTTLPYTATFSTDADLDCWTMIDADGDNSTWRRDAQDGVLMVESNAGADDWAVMPAIAIPDDADGMLLSYQVAARFSSGSAAYELRLSTSGIDTADFDTVLVAETVGGTFVDRQQSLDPWAGQTVRLALRHIASAGGTGLTVDNIRVRSAQIPVVAISGPTYVGVGMQGLFSATLTQGSESGLGYQWASSMEQNGHATMTTSNNEDTLYITYDTLGTDTITVLAMNNYGNGYAMMVVPVVALQPAALPYSTGFEATDDTEWHIIGSVNGWHIGTAVSHTGNQALYISADGGVTATYDTATPAVSYAIRPVNVANAADYTVSFHWRSVGESNDGDPVDFLRAFLVPADIILEAGVIPGNAEYTTDFTIPDGWIDLADGALQSDDDTWTLHEQTVSISQTGDYNIVFLWMNDNAEGSGIGAAIDDLRLAEVTCLTPHNLIHDSSSTTSISLHWTAVGSESQWLVDAGGTSVVVSTPHATISGLNPCYHYMVSVRALCGEGDTSEAVTATMSTEADCSPVSLPWTETFEGWSSADENFLSPCWKRMYTYGTYYSDADRIDDKPYLRSDNYFSETGALRMYGAYGGNWFGQTFISVAVLPELAPRDTAGVSVDLNVQFFEFQYDPTTGDTSVVDFLDVGYLTDENNPTSFVLGATIDNIFGHNFTQVSVDLPNYTPSLGRLALRYRYTKPDDFYYVVIDDIAVRPYSGEPVGPQPEDSTGISTLNTLLPSLTVYPNPANSMLSVGGVEAGTLLSIVDLNGREVMRTVATSETTYIDVSALPRGIYFIRATSIGTSRVKKLNIR